MNIYTYYEDIGFTEQNRLIELWMSSWEHHGFTPIVLTRKDAEQHEYYNEYVDGLNTINQRLYGKDMDKYCLSCFLRWLAYTSISDKNILVSDYDVINGAVGISEFYNYNNERINLLQGACPSLAIGTSKQFIELCRMFITMSLSNIDEIKKRSSWMNLTFFHDQHFFIFLKDKLQKINFSNNTELIHGTEHATSTDRKNRLIHFSHRYTKIRNSIPLTLSNVNMRDLERMRVDLVEEFLRSLLIL